MRGSIKIGFVMGVLLALVVSASGCTVNLQNPATPTATPTAQATNVPTQTPTAATTAPKSTGSVPGSIDSYFVSQGYTVTEALSYHSVDSNGNTVYRGDLSRGGRTYAVDVTVCPSASVAASNLAAGVTAAKDGGYSGNYISDSHWSGSRSSEGTTYSLDLWTTNDNWSIMSVGA